MSKVVKVRLLSNSHHHRRGRWCEPVGWEPKNQIDGFEYEDGMWWDENDDYGAALMWIGDRDSYGPNDVIETILDNLVVAFHADSLVCQKVVEV